MKIDKKKYMEARNKFLQAIKDDANIIDEMLMYWALVC